MYIFYINVYIALYLHIMLRSRNEYGLRPSWLLTRFETATCTNLSILSVFYLHLVALHILYWHTYTHSSYLTHTYKLIQTSRTGTPRTAGTWCRATTWPWKYGTSTWRRSRWRPSPCMTTCAPCCTTCSRRTSYSTNSRSAARLTGNASPVAATGNISSLKTSDLSYSPSVNAITASLEVICNDYLSMFLTMWLYYSDQIMVS